LWSGENLFIPAESAKLVSQSRRRLEGRGFCRIHATRRAKPRKKISASRNHLSFVRQGTSHIVENHTKEDVEISLQQRLGTIHSLDIVNRAWLKEELRGRHEQEVGEDDSEQLSKNVNSMHESDYPTEEIKKKFTHESF